MNRILLQGNYGAFWGLTDEQLEFVKSRGLDPDAHPWKENRHHPVYLEMFDVFQERGMMKGKGCLSEHWVSLPGYLVVAEIEGDTYTITDYDGKESVKEPRDIVWTTINSNNDEGF